MPDHLKPICLFLFLPPLLLLGTAVMLPSLMWLPLHDLARRAVRGLPLFAFALLDTSMMVARMARKTWEGRPRTVFIEANNA